MRLQKVEYHLFEHEVDHIDHAGDGSHELDRELCLIDLSNQRTFVSWQQNRDSYYIEVKDASFFVNDSIVVDASQYDLWSRLIGKDVRLGYLDNEKQILKISCDDEMIFVYAYETK